MDTFDYLVVGAGISGATFARRKTEQGFSVLVLEKRDHIAGNAYDYMDKQSGLLIHKYGPHLFHTNSVKVVNFLSDYTAWRPYSNRVRAMIGEKSVSLPINFTSIKALFDENTSRHMIDVLSNNFKTDQRFTLKQLENLQNGWTQELWSFVYENVFKNYTQKMWNLSLEELGPTVADRVPLIAGNDDRYFADKYQMMPSEGYTEMVGRMLDHHGITVKLSTDPSSCNCIAHKVFHTGSIDEFCANIYGTLPYRGMSFETRTNRWHREHLGHASTLNLPAHPFVTRMTSMLRVNGNEYQLKDEPEDVQVVETPCDGEQFYPIPTESNRELYRKYEQYVANLHNVRFGGRLGTYQYLNIDQAVAQALKIAEEF